MTNFFFAFVNFMAICSLASALSSQVSGTDVGDNIKASTTFLPIVIPIDRAFDVQWNPPGHPKLSADLLDIPWGDRGSDPWAYHDSDHDHRTGQYTFLRQSTDDDEENLSFVRVMEDDGSYVQVFERVQFLLISDDVLMFNGDPHEDDWFPAGGGFGTIIKAPSIPSGDAPGVYDTEPLGENDMPEAKEWLLKNFGVEESSTPKPGDVIIIEPEGSGGNEGNDIVHDDEFMTHPPPYDDAFFLDTHNSTPITLVCGNHRFAVGLGTAAITGIVISVTAVVAAIVIVVVKCRKGLEVGSDPDKTSIDKNPKEGSVAVTCEDTGSITDV